MSGIKELMEHVSINVLEKIIASFTAATGLHAIIVDTNGRQQLASIEKNCKFCNMVLNDPVGCNKCMGSYARAGKQAAQFGEPYIFRCHAGLVAFAAPIVIEGEFIGSIICGQVLMWEPEDFFWEEIEEATINLNVNPKALISAVGELEVISSQKVQAAADMLFAVANHIVQTGAETFKQKREIERRENQLNNEIQYRKSLEKIVEGRVNALEQDCFEKERELMSEVRLGNKQEAQRLIIEVVADISERFIRQPKLFKMRVLELMAMISRSAVEGGANPDVISNIKIQYLNDFSEVDETNNLCDLLFKVMDRCIDNVYGNINSNYVGRAIKHIRENYNKNLNLTNIANAVYISPCYLSHIFKAQTNSTIMEYVTRVRIEEAKKLLHNPNISMLNISERIGYKDPGYFSKVFKKNEGVTPKVFKRQLM